MQWFYLITLCGISKLVFIIIINRLFLSFYCYVQVNKIILNWLIQFICNAHFPIDLSLNEIGIRCLA